MNTCLLLVDTYLLKDHQNSLSTLKLLDQYNYETNNNSNNIDIHKSNQTVLNYLTIVLRCNFL